MSKLEIVASLLGLISVWLTTKQNIWCWPIGIIMVSAYAFIFYEARLYSDLMLQLVYVVMQFYGWYYWIYGNKNSEELKVTKLSSQQIMMWTIVLIVGSIVLGWLMKKYTNADLPYWDATTTAMSLIAQWLMTKKIIENWILWIVADVLYVGVYFYKHLYPTTVLYAVFIALCFLGLRDWKKELKTVLVR